MDIRAFEISIAERSAVVEIAAKIVRDRSGRTRHRARSNDRVSSCSRTHAQ